MNDSIKIAIDNEQVSPAKNSDGSIGDKCFNCGGYGYTIGISGKNASCQACEGTGELLPTRKELTERLEQVEFILKGMITMKGSN